MFRTRDFFLLFVTIMFLVVAISSTLISRIHKGIDTTVLMPFAGESIQDFSAEIYQPEAMSREERLNHMRQQIAENGGVQFTAPEEVLSKETELIQEEFSSSSEEVLVESAVETGALRCPDYKQYEGIWLPQDIKFMITDQYRMVYHEYRSTQASSGTSAPPVATQTQQDIIVALPAWPVVQASANCLATDVIGIAQDGSLIRNYEIELYGVFEEETLIGYALDGFPIYGVSTQAVDDCGGSVVSGGYRYTLSPSRDFILNCYRATPVALP